jgi:hypothetical protein
MDSLENGIGQKTVLASFNQQKPDGSDRRSSVNLIIRGARRMGTQQPDTG